MSDYAGPILGAVGAVVGFYYGGPTGAQWGWAIGSMIGGAYSASQQVIPGPKIGDVQKQTSQEGGFRPIIYGRSVPMMGNIIADGGPKIVRKKESSGGKGGPKVETEYAYRTYAVGFCEGEADLLQAWRNGILVYDSENPSMASENAKFLEYATWHRGTFDQNADPDLEGVYGVGDAPFFRGTAYLVLANEDVTDGRGMWSQWQVRVFRGAAKSYTTVPYEVYLEERVNFEIEPAGGLLRTIMHVSTSEDSVPYSIEPVGGRLRAPLQVIGVEDETLYQISPVGGDLRSGLDTANAQDEEAIYAIEPVSGELRAALIVTNPDVNETNFQIQPVGGRLQ